MILPFQPTKNLISSRTPSNSDSSSSVIIPNQWVHQLEKRLWRAIDFLHIIVMIFSLYTGIIVAILRNELLEQCPLYAKLILRDNVTQLLTDTIDQQTEWGSVYTCEFASFAYLSTFAVSFISLWIHIVFRRVIRTERLLRLPIGLLTLIFTLITLIATAITTDGVIKFCTISEPYICSSSGAVAFSNTRWKVISLPVGGWLTTLSILLNAIARGFQLFAKPKKSPETLKVLLGQLMANRHQLKLEKESSEYGSQISKEKYRSPSVRRHSIDQTSNRGGTPELYPSYYPPIPQYRQIEKRSRFQRICCPCLNRRRRRRQQQQQRSFNNSYRPYIVPEEYYHRSNNPKQNGDNQKHLCQQHATHQPIEQQTQTKPIPQRKNIDEINEVPFLGRRRSSVRFEDEIAEQKPPSQKIESIPIIKIDEPEEKPSIPIVENINDLQRNVSFRNNEDDLWTTITINSEQSSPVQSSHYNRLTLENLSSIDTSVTNSNNGVTAILVNSTTIESASPEKVEEETPTSSSPPPPPPPPPPPLPQTPSKPARHRHKPSPPTPSRSHTASSEDETDIRHIKPVEEIHTIVTDKYNYNNLSQALKSNVERLKNTFINAQEKQSPSDKPILPKNSSSTHSSDC